MRNLAGSFGALAAALLLAAATRAQLADLQPGRNFVAQANFGLNRSANIDGGDVDNDGDLDVVVANGTDFGDEPNRIFINQGGLQFRGVIPALAGSISYRVECTDRAGSNAVQAVMP
jgi:hypothetical protein